MQFPTPIPEVVWRDWLVTFAHKVATERNYSARHPGHVFLVMLRRDEAEGLLQQTADVVAALAAAEETKWGDNPTRMRLLARRLSCCLPASPKRALKSEAEVVLANEKLAALRNALEAYGVAIEKHPLWCGYRREAPGDDSLNEAQRIARAALAAAEETK
jgi:hypothetical protein